MGALLARQPRCAAASIPSASPLSTGQPASARARPSSPAIARPCSEAERVPTTAIASRAFRCRSSDRAPWTNSPAGGGPPGPNSLARQDHLAEEHSWGPQDRAPPPAHICIDRCWADSATASPALGKDALWASPRADPAQWIGRDRKRADPPCVNSPGPDNKSIATTNPHRLAASTFVLAQLRFALGPAHKPCLTSFCITNCNSDGTRLSTRP